MAATDLPPPPPITPRRAGWSPSRVLAIAVLFTMIGAAAGSVLTWLVIDDEPTDVVAAEPDQPTASSTPATTGTIAPTTTSTTTTTTPTEYKLRGSFTLYDSDGVVGGWTGCYGSGGYDDFGPGMDVTIRDGSGAIIAMGRTRSLAGADQRRELAWMSRIASAAKDADGRFCTVVFNPITVPRSDFYAVEIGNRGELRYSFEELEWSGWTVDLALG